MSIAFIVWSRSEHEHCKVVGDEETFILMTPSAFAAMREKARASLQTAKALARVPVQNMDEMDTLAQSMLQARILKASRERAARLRKHAVDRRAST